MGTDGPNRRRRVWCGVGLSLLVAVAGACNGDDGGGGPTTTAATVTGDPVDGGTIRIGLPGPVRVDPAAANPGSPSDLMVLDLLHDGVVRMDDAGVLQPALAESWRHNGKHTAWAFEIDPEATFASGRRVTNEDVVASIERVAKAGDTSLAALRLEDIQGFRAFVDGKAAHLSGLVARDDGSVYVALTGPIATFPVVLAAPEMGVVDVASLEASVEADDLGELDLSGSWSVAEADGESLALDRRDRRPGHLDGIVLRGHDDPGEAYDAFDAGDVDWALVPPDEHGDAVEEHGDEHFAPFHAELFFGMRVTGGDLAKPSLRRAIAKAIDRDAIVEEVFADRADPLASVVPAGVPGHDDGVCSGCGHDPEGAEDALVDAYPDGDVPTVRIDFDESPAQEAMAEMVADDLESAGIPTQLRPLPLDEYKEFVVAGDQQLFSFGWIGGYRSPDAYLEPLFQSAADDNLTGIAHGGVDKVLAEARAADDPKVAADRWRRAERRVLADAVVVPIAQFRVQPVVAGRVQGLSHVVDGTVDWAAVWLTDGAG